MGCKNPIKPESSYMIALCVLSLQADTVNGVYDDWAY